eukprot:CAMPEP_0172669808 /NCGR_PEP_ID=MMETSP1074-20121228/9912_1 /TAXON_ID=2916 /ORGANISM="Ceratium fusus, Strain PA161109" /LENGTH=205 /DNA_ID=CAMNT_0013486635 /DNA_START=300 /DNA_END=916 /DNA_ORIENTATION=+
MAFLGHALTAGVRTNAMLLAIDPLTAEEGTVRPDEHALSMFVVLLIFTFVFPAIRPCHGADPMELASLKLPVVLPAVVPPAHTPAMLRAVEELAFVPEAASMKAAPGRSHGAQDVTARAEVPGLLNNENNNSFASVVVSAVHVESPSLQTVDREESGECPLVDDQPLADLADDHASSFVQAIRSALFSRLMQQCKSNALAASSPE